MGSNLKHKPAVHRKPSTPRNASSHCVAIPDSFLVPGVACTAEDWGVSKVAPERVVARYQYGKATSTDVHDDKIHFLPVRTFQIVLFAIFPLHDVTYSFRYTPVHHSCYILLSFCSSSSLHARLQRPLINRIGPSTTMTSETVLKHHELIQDSLIKRS